MSAKMTLSAIVIGLGIAFCGNILEAGDRRQLKLELRAFAQEICLGEPLPVVVTIYDDPQKPIKQSCSNSIL